MQILDGPEPELRRDVNVAAVFYVPLLDVLPLENGHTFAFRAGIPGAFGRMLAQMFRQGHEKELLGPLDVSLRFFRVRQETTDLFLDSMLSAATAGWPNEFGVDAESLGELGQAAGAAQADITVVEAVVPLEGSEEVLLGDTDTDAFAAARDDALDRAFGAIRRLQMAISFATATSIRPLTNWTCPTSVILHGIRRKDGLGSTIEPLSALVLGDQYLRGLLHAERTSETLGDDGWDGVHWLLGAQDLDDPIVRVLELRHEATRFALVEGEAVSAIAMLHSANDLLLQQTFRCLLWEDGTEPDSARSLLDERSHSAALVKTHLPQRLRGRWGTSQSGPVKEWYDNCHLLRQRVLHGGEIPTIAAVDAALQASAALEEHVVARLVANAEKYPKTCAMMAGWMDPLDDSALREARDTRKQWNERFRRWTFRLTERVPGSDGDALMWMHCHPGQEARVYTHRASTFGVCVFSNAVLPQWIRDEARVLAERAVESDRALRSLVVCPDEEFPPTTSWVPDWELDPHLFSSSAAEPLSDIPHSFVYPDDGK